MFLRQLDTFKETLAGAKERKGQRPRDRKSKAELFSKYTITLMSSRLQSQSSGYQLHSSFVPPAYHPCTTPLAELKPIAIKDLKLETYHRLTYLLLRSLTPPCRMTAITTIMEDVSGDAETLQIYQQEDEEVRKAASIIDIGTVFIVKEPYYKVMADGSYGLRVDHLSDVVTLDETDERVPKAWMPRVIQTDHSAESFKALGNLAMGEGKYWDAIKERDYRLPRKT
jgi:hypothetical protein